MLGTDHLSMSLSEFLGAHVKSGSRKDGKLVPAFYHPAETPSGPDFHFFSVSENVSKTETKILAFVPPDKAAGFHEPTRSLESVLSGQGRCNSSPSRRDQAIVAIGNWEGDAPECELVCIDVTEVVGHFVPDVLRRVKTRRTP